MTSLRHNPGPDDAYLDAARACILAVGWKRTTLTDVARRAGVSRMTIYRRWPDMQTLLADLMVREWSGLVTDAGLQSGGTAFARLAEGITRTVTALRANDLFRRIVEIDPELLLPYLFSRPGRTQEGILAITEVAIAEGQQDGSVRKGDPTLMARALLLAAHGFALSAETMGVEHAELDTELQTLVERYLAP
jgi:AcrR family transcriptional regulator